MSVRRSATLSLVAALGLLAAVTGRTTAMFTDSRALGANVFATAPCFRADFKSTQTGTTTSSANGTVTVNITAVDTTKAFLTFSTRHSSNRPVGAVIRGRIASSTTLEFARVTDETSTMTIRWYVVEYSCGIRVQRGETAQSATTINVPITPVVATSQAFVTWSKTAATADGAWDSNDTAVVDLTATNNLQIRTPGANASHLIWWQVVEFISPLDISVQRGTTSITGTATYGYSTLGTPVDLSRSFVLADIQSAGSGADIGARMVRPYFYDASNVVFDRSATGSPDDITEVSWQVVELKDGSSVQRGTAAFASGSATTTATLNLTDTTRATAFGSFQYGGGQSSGRTGYVTDDIAGVASATVTVTDAFTVTLTRTSTAAAADIAWFVVEWGAPTAVKSVQQGTATSSANGTVTVNVNSVDTTKSVLFFNTSHSNNRPGGATIRGRVASATTLQFIRVTGEAPVSTMTIQWYLVEYARGVKVQRGDTSMTATTVNVPITAVGALRQAYTTFSKTANAGDTGWDTNDAVIVDLSSTSNVQIRADAADANHVVSWQVVEFLSVSAADVQRGTTNMTTTTLSRAVTLGTAVDTSKTFVLVSMRTSGSGTDIGARLLRARLTNSTTVTIDRSVSGTPDDLTEIAWQSIELKDGSAVQSGTAAFANGAPSTTATLTTVVPSLTIAIGSAQQGAGQSGGRSSYVTDDIPGVASATHAVTSPTQLTLTRASTAGPADIGWFVIQVPAP